MREWVNSREDLSEWIRNEGLPPSSVERAFQRQGPGTHYEQIARDARSSGLEFVFVQMILSKCREEFLRNIFDTRHFVAEEREVQVSGDEWEAFNGVNLQQVFPETIPCVPKLPCPDERAVQTGSARGVRSITDCSVQ